ncbi:MAG: methyltransferase domain-containing protein [Gemmatimonadota bacterium]|nr:methyltransferase domain-containing protein [Gemmatimonadota bacterium]
MGNGSNEGFSYFAEIAASYDRVQSVLSPPYERGLEMIVELIPFDTDEPFEFVDLGCGTAEPTARALQRFGRATGSCIDSEPEMLRIAKRKLTPYAGRYDVREADITEYAIPPCDVVFSAKTFHHVHPDRLPSLIARVAGALRPGGCFILYDTMSVGPGWSAAVRQQASRFRERHVQRAIDSGRVTRVEIDARREYKRMMKAAGKDVEYEHRAEDLIGAMTGAGFEEVAVVWRSFADTILLAFVTAGDS